MLPPQPEPDVPQGADPPRAPALPALDLPAACLLALFCLGCDFWVWSCGLLLRSNVCAQPRLTRKREHKSARRKKFFFTGPPLSESQREHVATRFHGRYMDLAKAACLYPRQQLCSHSESRCHFCPEGLLAPVNSQNRPSKENPDATQQTPPPLF